MPYKILFYDVYPDFSLSCNYFTHTVPSILTQFHLTEEYNFLKQSKMYFYIFDFVIYL